GTAAIPVKIQVHAGCPVLGMVPVGSNVIGIDAEPALLSDLGAVQPENSARRDGPRIHIVARFRVPPERKIAGADVDAFPVRQIVSGKGGNAGIRGGRRRRRRRRGRLSTPSSGSRDRRGGNEGQRQRGRDSDVHGGTPTPSTAFHASATVNCTGSRSSWPSIHARPPSKRSRPSQNQLTASG